MAPKHKQLQIFIQANITMRKKLKTYKEQPHLVSGHFIKVFYKMTTCPTTNIELSQERSSYTGLTVFMI